MAIERYSTPRRTGRLADRNELDAFNRECGGSGPAWFIDLDVAYPLFGIEIGWPDREDSDELTSLDCCDMDGIEPAMLRGCYVVVTFLGTIKSWHASN